MKRTLGLSLAVTMVLLPMASSNPQARAADNAAVIEDSGRAEQKIELRLKPTTGPDGKSQPISREALDRAAEIFRKRAKARGIAEPEIQVKLPDRVVVLLPGVGAEGVARWENALTKGGKLEFRMIHPNSEMLLPQIEAGAAILDPAYEIVDFIPRSKAKPMKIIVAKKIEITGDKVGDAGPLETHRGGGWEVHFSFNDEGKQQFADVTGRMAANATQGSRERFAILLDHIVISAAGLSEDAIQSGGIRGGYVQISGQFEEQEARSIADALLHPLDHAVEIVATNSSGGSQGKDAKR